MTPLSDRPATDLRGVIILAGGTAERLGGISKPDIKVAGARLLDHLWDSLDAAGVIAPRVVVGPPELQVADGALLTREDPPLGGPAAGIGAGLAALGITAEAPFLPEDRRIDDADALVALATCDAPLAPRLLPDLCQALCHTPNADGAAPVVAAGDPFVQYTQGVFRVRALRPRQWPRDSSVRKIFRSMSVVEVVHSGELSWDVNTPEDVARLDAHLRGR